MKLSSYQNAVKVANLELQLAKAKLAYFQYLFNVLDLYENAADCFVGSSTPPKGGDVKPEETTECQKHIDKIQNLETKIYQTR